MTARVTTREFASSFESVSWTRQENKELSYPRRSGGLHLNSYAVSSSPNTSFVSTSVVVEQTRAGSEEGRLFSQAKQLQSK